MHIILGKKDATLSTEKVSSMVTLTLGHVGWSMCRLRWQRAVPGVRLVDKLSGPRASNVIRIEAWSWNHVLFVSWYRLMMYPLVNIQKLWKIHFFNGKINYKWPMFYSYVKLPEGNIIPIYLICIYIYILFIHLQDLSWLTVSMCQPINQLLHRHLFVMGQVSAFCRCEGLVLLFCPRQQDRTTKLKLLSTPNPNKLGNTESHTYRF